MSDDDDGATATPLQPFRFKDDATRTDDAPSGGTTRSRKRRHHHGSHRSDKDKQSHSRFKRRRREDSETAEQSNGLNLDDAFRESLFDAMGDDEGANFWEGVYGQPIHNYPNTFVNEDTGELEIMTDDEYATYVRRKMWEKSREGVEAKREERRQEKAREKAEEEAKHQRARKRRKPKVDGEAYDNFTFDFAIDASLRRGQQRKDQKRWRELWQHYLQRWEQLQEMAKTRDPSQPTENLFLRNKIAWPVESGQRKDVKAEEIRRFIRDATAAVQADNDADDGALSAALKVERVRWHPDKIQQRYGFMEIDKSTMEGVTATFQVLDTMWNELRNSKLR
ncbi:uncharacterized protein AB675_4988 [Cyphellophora attinorum]|uniref:Uncharacterized protein n=1 Tax=Cyphellophora attinorum TaxID=1664694 RepID=A0A0N1NZX9_9EURO|nr:uncharacterized protein AB675_4988 [Phialophora attinorum]KPI39457.1 hypothetical protein AB675_4988 [Phialophora attinorum]